MKRMKLYALTATGGMILAIAAMFLTTGGIQASNNSVTTLPSGCNYQATNRSCVRDGRQGQLYVSSSSQCSSYCMVDTAQ